MKFGERLICDGWLFSKNPIDTEYSETLDWEPADLPHDWLIGNTNDLYETSTGWYKKIIPHEKKDGVRTAVRFEGVYMDCRVYVNGSLAGEWKYGYSTFEFDITELLCEGDNVLTVRVDYRSPNSRWYSGAGIYRRVWLRTYPDCHIVSDGVYISADINGCVTVSAEAARPEGISPDSMSMRQTVSCGDEIICSGERPLCACDISVIPEPVRAKGFKYSVNTLSLHVDKPRLWDVDDPQLYTMTTELVKDNEVIHRAVNRFGFKKAEFTCDRGFFLNGRHLKLHGACEHHDLGCLGSAVNRNAVARKLRKLRAMGVNAIRTSHNMPAVELMELADEMGILILAEGFDMWERSKTDYDYGRFFPHWIEKDVASWVRRDRNHASLIGWSIGNEIYDTHADERGQEIASKLLHLVRLHDPRKNGYVTIGSNYMQWEGAQKCADIVKLAGYNYAERLYEEQHKAHPDWMIYGSETSSVVQSRGIYHFPLSRKVLADDDEQCSALGNSSPGWAAKSTEACIIPDRDAEYCAGQFIWTGFDYIGEPTPYATKNSYFGQFDTAGFPKDSAYLFRAEWTDHKKAPFVHIYPYWDFMEGQDIDVRVCTNAPRAELFLNGVKIGEKDFDHLHGTELTLDVNIPYEKGELLAIAYDENGNEIARDVQRSFGDTAEIRILPENDTLRAGSDDLIFLEIAAFDKDGVHTANANNRVNVEVTGAGRLIGLDNGDSTDYEQYKSTSRRLFSGKLLAVIGAKEEAGDIIVKVTSPEVKGSEMTFKALPHEKTEGISLTYENKPCMADCPDEANDIPVRKITFESERRSFDPEHREIEFTVKTYPENSSYKNDITFRVTTALGITSNLGEIVSESGGKVKIRCRGDGEFYLRALCRNGTDKYHIVTALKLTGEGIGSASFDPYGFVAGGLFGIQNGKATNGIDRGAKFAYEPSWFGFENVDFGPVGSDTVTVPIFSNNATPVHISFYDGDPDKGGEFLGEFEYSKPSIWLTYQAETYKLNKVLRGMHTFVMKSSDGFDVQGFTFEKTPKERGEINASCCESVYGDKFTREKDAVTGIGNNVILDFGEFDFGEDAPRRLIITGRSELAANSIHLILSGDTEKRILCEFEGCPEYTARSFDLEEIKGRCKVSFCFLPGCDFDFRTFRFEG